MGEVENKEKNVKLTYEAATALVLPDDDGTFVGHCGAAANHWPQWSHAVHAGRDCWGQ